MLFVAVHESLDGTFETCRRYLKISRGLSKRSAPPRVRLRGWRVNPLLQLRLKPRVRLPPKRESSPSLRLPETQTNVYTLNVIAIICGLGVAVFVCLATSGLDMSVGFF